MNATYNITSKFQVTIPKEIRDEIRLTVNDKVSFERRGQEIVLKRAPSMKEVSKMLAADLKRRGWDKVVSNKEMKQARDIFYKQGGKW